MRVIIAAPRKSGSAQLRCLLAMAYGLKGPATDAPAPSTAAAVTAWARDLAGASVSTCDLTSSLLVAPARDADVSLVAIIRHPFDLFLSNYEVAQQRANRQRDEADNAGSWSQLAGLELASPQVAVYARGAFSEEAQWLRDWAESGAPVVRYEALLHDPAATLAGLAPTFGALTREQAEHAVALCPAENAVASRPGKGRRMPAVTPGSWRSHLPEPLLEILQAQYAKDAVALGYDIA